MTTFKGENSSISLIEETTWGVKLASYSGAKIFQNNDGTFNAERSALESEARTPNSELSGQRLGNTNVSGSFPVELDPTNYNHIFESVFYGRFTKSGSPVVLVDVLVSGPSLYNLEVETTSSEQTSLGAKIGDAYILSGIDTAGLQKFAEVMVLTGIGATSLTFFTPVQTEATLSAVLTDVTISPVDTLRPSKQRKSFNAEETLSGEDGTSTARFMTVGVISSGCELDLPSDNNIKATFSFIGSGKEASSDYNDFDSNLVNGEAAHTGVVDHIKNDPMVLQDGAIISEDSDIRCQWLSGSVTIENGTEAYFVGCSYDAAGANSGSFRVNLSYEALFESEEAYREFKKENSSKVLLKLNVRGTKNCLMLYLPAFKATSYVINNAKGLVTASITGSAEIDVDAVNSAILASYTE
jgi:hypothetical protein